MQWKCNGKFPTVGLIKVYLALFYAYQACFFWGGGFVKLYWKIRLAPSPQAAFIPCWSTSDRACKDATQGNYTVTWQNKTALKQAGDSLGHCTNGNPILHGTLQLVPTRSVQFSTRWHLPGTRYYYSNYLARVPNRVEPKMFCQSASHWLDGERKGRKRRRRREMPQWVTSSTPSQKSNLGFFFFKYGNNCNSAISNCDVMTTFGVNCAVQMRVWTRHLV